MNAAVTLCRVSAMVHTLKPHLMGLAGRYFFINERPLKATIASSIDSSFPGRYLLANEADASDDSGPYLVKRIVSRITPSSCRVVVVRVKILCLLLEVEAMLSHDSHHTRAPYQACHLKSSNGRSQAADETPWECWAWCRPSSLPRFSVSMPNLAHL